MLSQAALPFIYQVIICTVKKSVRNGLTTLSEEQQRNVIPQIYLLPTIHYLG